MYSTELVLPKESLVTATTNPSIKEYKMGGMSIYVTLELLARFLTTLPREGDLSMVMFMRYIWCTVFRINTKWVSPAFEHTLDMVTGTSSPTTQIRG